MESRTVVWIGMVVGSTIGGLIPMIWNAGIFSISGLVFSSLGAIAGIYIAFKLTH